MPAINKNDAPGIFIKTFSLIEYHKYKVNLKTKLPHKRCPLPKAVISHQVLEYCRFDISDYYILTISIKSHEAAIMKAKPINNFT